MYLAGWVSPHSLKISKKQISIFYIYTYIFQSSSREFSHFMFPRLTGLLHREEG